MKIYDMDKKCYVKIANVENPTSKVEHFRVPFIVMKMRFLMSYTTRLSQL